MALTTSRQAFKSSALRGVPAPSARRVVVACRASATGSEESRRVARRVVLSAGLGAALVSLPMAPMQGAAQAFSVPVVDFEKREGEVRHNEEEWRQILGKDAYRVVRQGSTELPFSSALNGEKRKGTFVCAGCSTPLFDSSTKYNSGTGWPSFYKALPGAVDEVLDVTIAFLPRTEVRCHTCKGHLGHVFDDGPQPTGLRYCMNGLALGFKAASDAPSA